MKKLILLSMCLNIYFLGHAISNVSSVPVISSLIPSSGAIGSVLTINGVGFSSTASSNVVYLGAVKATITASTATNITVTVPAGAGSIVPVSVAVNGMVAYSATCHTPTFNITNTPELTPNYVSNSVTLGFNPRSIAVGDINNDGIPDMILTNSSDSTISVFPGNGDGTFADSTNYKVGSSPMYVVIGDFNGDGISDLAVANNGVINMQMVRKYEAMGAKSKSEDLGYSVSIILGTGDGSFSVARNFEVDKWPVSIAVGDFNADGKTDLAVVNNGSDNVSILTGNGDGSFAPAVGYAVGSMPLTLVTGDFNGDGIVDLATANSADSTVSVLYGKGDGSFETAINLELGNNARYLVAGDFNKDGNCDFAVANSEDGNINVLYGNSSGGFSQAINYLIGSRSYSIVTGDFNGDGIADLAVTNSRSREKTIIYKENTVAKISAVIGTFSVSILPGKSIGGFGAIQNLNLGGQSGSLIVADFNHDGRADMAALPFTSNSVTVMLYSSPAIVTTQAATNIELSTVTAHGNISFLGDIHPNQYGFVWSNHPNTLFNTARVFYSELGNATSTGAFTYDISGLEPDTTYFIKAYATSITGTVYGEELSFKTKDLPSTLDNLTATTFSIYPNPITSGFMINGATDKGCFSIFDLRGNCVLKQQVVKNRFIDISGLPKGIYVLKMNGQVVKLIKE
jgi:hypothetical protein